MKGFKFIFSPLKLGARWFVWENLVVSPRPLGGGDSKCVLTEFQFNTTDVVVQGRGRSKAHAGAARQGRHGNHHLIHVFLAVTLVDAVHQCTQFECYSTVEWEPMKLHHM